MLGPAALGVYGFAWQLTSLPVEKVTALVGRVTPAILSANQDDRERLQRYLHRITEGIALLTIPATTGIALVAGDVIPVVFGDKWAMAVAPLRILAATMALRSIVPVVINALRAINDVRFVMWHGIITAILFPLCFYVGARAGGINGVAYTWLCAYPLAVIPLYWRARRMHLVSVRGYAKALLPAIEGSAGMALLVYIVRYTVFERNPAFSPAVLCAAEIVAGVVAYAGVLLLRHRGRITSLRSLLLAR
jgi:PST family polysaccharide transporter